MPINLNEKEAPVVEQTEALAQAKGVEKTKPSKAKKERKILIYIPEKTYRAMVLKCYGRDKTVEQLAEELLIVKFSE